MSSSHSRLVVSGVGIGRVASGAVLAVILLASAVGQVAPVPTPAGDSVVLSPFEVIGDPRDTYEALNTNSITGVSRELAQLPITAEVFTEQALADLAVTNTSDLLNHYTAGMGAGLSTGPDVGEGSLGGDSIGGSFSMRGVGIGEPRRDGLLGGTGLLLDSYNTGRVEIIRGPQSLLYGAGSAAGVINTSTKRPVFGTRFLRLGTQVDTNRTARGTLDLNYSGTLGGRAFGVRLNGVSMGKRYWRDIVRTDTLGGAVAVAFRPTSRITLRAEAEQVERTDITPGRQLVLVDRRHPLNGVRLPVILAQGGGHDILNGKLSWDNVNSLLGDFGGNTRKYRVFSASADVRFNDWLSGQVQTGRMLLPNSLGQAIQFGGLTAPTEPINPTGKWAVNTRVQFLNDEVTQNATRASLAADFKLGRVVRNQLVVGAEKRYSTQSTWYQQFFEVDAAGNFIVNHAQITNTNQGRTLSPVFWIPVEDGLHGPFNTRTREITTPDGKIYRLTAMRLPGIVPPTPTNPLGAAPSPNFSYTQIRQTAGFGALFSSWFDGKVDTLAGYRLEDYEKRFVEVGGAVPATPRSINLGAVYHFTPSWSAYYGYSDSFNPPTSSRRDYKNEMLPPGEGNGHEVGVKFSLFEQRLSGSVGVYRIEAKGQNAASDVQLVNLTDPVGINGRLANASSFAYSFDNRAEGVEVTLTAKPTKNSRLRFGFVHSDGKVSSDVEIPIKYNDQFNTNAGGAVTYSDGTVYMVRSNPANASSPLMPLTVAMMRDPSSPYFAVLDPASGLITNATALGLTRTLPNGATIGTGRVGLPISAHQLGFMPPGGPLVVARRGGEKTTGYPVDSFNVTGNYRFGSGRLAGLSIGSSITARFNQRAYYYNDAATQQRVLLKWDDQVQVMAFASYERRLSQRIHWQTQLNVTNVFNTVDIRKYPAINTGVVGWATYSSDPRQFIWSNTFSF